MTNITSTKTIEDHLNEQIKPGTIVYPEVEALRYVIAEQKKLIQQMESDLSLAHRDIAKLSDEINWLESGMIHTCHDGCDRWPCVMKRENEKMKEIIKTLQGGTA